ncbi:MAG TPA: TolC family protein [Geomonas sp.]|nr:TolC family protein [Geomonas sp.]
MTKRIIFLIAAALLVRSVPSHAQLPGPATPAAAPALPPSPLAGEGAAGGKMPASAGSSLPLTLAEAQKLALKNNPRISEALLNAAAALEVRSQYRAAYLPTLQGNLTGVISDKGSRLAAGGLNNPVLYNRFAAGVSLNQMVTDFGRTSQLVDMARLKADAQNQLAEQSRQDVLLVTGQAYFEVLRAQAVLKVARKTVAARQYLVDQVSALAKNNLKTELDVSFAKVNLGDAQMMLVQAENSLKASQAQLAAVLGLPGDILFRLAEEPLPAQLAGDPEPLIRQALRNRPELKGRQLEEDAAQKFVQAEHALHYPTMNVMGAAGVVPAGQKQVDDRYGAAGFNISVPIFNGGLFKAREAEARLKAQAARERLDDLEVRVARDVRVACLEEKTAYRKVGMSEQLQKQAETAFDLAFSRYNLGLSSIVELSQAQLNLTSAQLAFASAKYEWEAKRLNVAYQTGALTPSSPLTSS